LPSGGCGRPFRPAGATRLDMDAVPCRPSLPRARVGPDARRPVASAASSGPTDCRIARSTPWSHRGPSVHLSASSPPAEPFAAVAYRSGASTYEPATRRLSGGPAVSTRQRAASLSLASIGGEARYQSGQAQAPRGLCGQARPDPNGRGGIGGVVLGLADPNGPALTRASGMRWRTRRMPPRTYGLSQYIGHSLPAHRRL
jgi:hypothetical protein